MILKDYYEPHHSALLSKRDGSGGLSSSAIGAIAGSIAAVILVIIICAFCWSHAVHRQRDFDRRQRRHLRQQIRTRQTSQRNSRASLRPDPSHNGMGGPLPKTQFSWKWMVRESGPPRTTTGSADPRKDGGAYVARPERTWERIPGGPRHPAYRAVPKGRMERLPRMKRVFPAPTRIKGMPRVSRTVGVAHADYQRRRKPDEEEEYSEEGTRGEMLGGAPPSKFRRKGVYRPRR